MAQIGVALVAALLVIVWWNVVEGRLKELWREWSKLPLFWKMVLSVVFGAFVLHGSTKTGESEDKGLWPGSNSAPIIIGAKMI